MKSQSGRTLTQLLVLMVTLLLIAGVATYVIIDSDIFSNDNSQVIENNKNTNEVN